MPVFLNRCISCLRFFTDDSELCSQASRGAPVSIQNLVRQVTVHLAGEDGGGDGGEDGGRQDKCTKKKTITAIILFAILLCLVGILFFIVVNIPLHFSTSFIIVVIVSTTISCCCCCLLLLPGMCGAKHFPAGRGRVGPGGKSTGRGRVGHI